MKIGIAIPCYKYHIPILKRCLDSIEEQTMLPNKVVVSCSSSVQSDLPEYKYSFPLIILVHEERKNAAQNRNIAAKQLDTDIISFFDCDDIMHPQRIEFIREMFIKEQCNIVLHNFLVFKEADEPFKYNPVPIFSINTLGRAPTGCAVIKDNYKIPIHHSQCSVKKDVMTRVQFREGKEFERKEDALFCGDVLRIKDYKSVYLDNKLSKYFAEGVWH